MMTKGQKWKSFGLAGFLLGGSRPSWLLFFSGAEGRAGEFTSPQRGRQNQNKARL